jgi:hypothetical protein
LTAGELAARSRGAPEKIAELTDYILVSGFPD